MSHHDTTRALVSSAGPDCCCAVSVSLANGCRPQNLMLHTCRCQQATVVLQQSSQRIPTWSHMAVRTSSSRPTDQALGSSWPWLISLERLRHLARMEWRVLAQAHHRAGQHLGEGTAVKESLPPSDASRWRCCRLYASWLDATSFPASKVRMAGVLAHMRLLQAKSYVLAASQQGVTYWSMQHGSHCGWV